MNKRQRKKQFKKFYGSIDYYGGIVITADMVKDSVTAWVQAGCGAGSTWIPVATKDYSGEFELPMEEPK